MASKAPFFKEFAVKTPIPVKEIIAKLIAKNIFPGIDLKQFGQDNMMLIAVTEMKRKCDLDELVKSLQEVTNG